MSVTISCRAECWLDSTLPVTGCDSFFSAAYGGRILPPRCPGRIECKALGLVNGGGGGDRVGEGGRVAEKFQSVAATRWE